MRLIEIFGENYFGEWNDTRAACRAIMIKDGKLLLSYEAKTGQYMIPGGGLENGEAEEECCVREVEEETGYIVKPSDCFLEIDEYYENFKWISRYFICEVTGEGRQALTQREMDVGMEPRWLPFAEIKEIFRKHQSYAETDEMRRGMYLREFTALCEFEKEL